jgi:hypothetical protein
MIDGCNIHTNLDLCDVFNTSCHLYGLDVVLTLLMRNRYGKCSYIFNGYSAYRILGAILEFVLHNRVQIKVA